MKRILVTGKNSYIGRSFISWLNESNANYIIDEIDVKGERWKTLEFSPYDVVYHVAGIAHIKETNENKHLYFSVNRDLPYNIAKKAKSDGVKQFIFLSSMSVYGQSTGTININTEPSPETNYGLSKMEAEKLLLGLVEDDFQVCILRPPMIYGRNCKGNYPKLSKLVRLMPFFLNIDNERSMLYIDNLNIFVKTLIDKEMNGTYFPQNSEYVNTTELARVIRNAHNKKLLVIPCPAFLIRMLNSRFAIFSKVFGTLKYEHEMMDTDVYKNQIEFEDSINKTER